MRAKKKKNFFPLRLGASYLIAGARREKITYPPAYGALRSIGASWFPPARIIEKNDSFPISDGKKKKKKKKIHVVLLVAIPIGRVTADRPWAIIRGNSGVLQKFLSPK